MRIGGNDYDLREVSGAFGDLGTLVPFVMGYLAINGLDPVGILVSTGLFQVAAGLYFRTPVSPASSSRTASRVRAPISGR